MRLGNVKRWINRKVSNLKQASSVVAVMRKVSFAFGQKADCEHVFTIDECPRVARRGYGLFEVADWREHGITRAQPRPAHLKDRGLRLVHKPSCLHLSGD